MSRLALALLSALAPAQVLAATIGVPLDHAVRVTLGAPASDVIVGNPTVADVTLADQRHLIITGKALGATNLIITGPRGRLLMNSEVLVGKPQVGHITLVAGRDTRLYSCAPECRKVDDQVLDDAGSLGSSLFGAMRNAFAPTASQTSSVAASPTTP